MSDTPQNSDKSDFNPKQLEVIAWLALPKSKRLPRTQKQLADKIAIDEDTICIWKQQPQFRKAVQNRIEENAIEHDAEVIRALVANATSSNQGSSSDRKLYLQWRNWLVESNKTEFVNDPYSKVIAELRKEREPQE